MNKLISAALVAMTVYPAYAAAAEGTPQDRSGVAATPMGDAQDTVDSGKMQEKMLRMHDQMHKIMNTKEGVERERLLQELAAQAERLQAVLRQMPAGVIMAESD